MKVDILFSTAIMMMIGQFMKALHLQEDNFMIVKWTVQKKVRQLLVIAQGKIYTAAVWMDWWIYGWIDGWLGGWSGHGFPFKKKHDSSELIHLYKRQAKLRLRKSDEKGDTDLMLDFCLLSGKNKLGAQSYWLHRSVNFKGGANQNQANHKSIKKIDKKMRNQRKRHFLPVYWDKLYLFA